MPHFERYIGIDYSGAETADSSCKGLRVYVAEGSGTPEPVQPRKCSRRRRFPLDDCGVGESIGGWSTSVRVSSPVSGSRERQVNVRVVPTGHAIDESVDLAHEIFNRVFRKVPERVNGG